MVVDKNNRGSWKAASSSTGDENNRGECKGFSKVGPDSYRPSVVGYSCSHIQRIRQDK